jgi:thiol-disulfide isomerase/thioredoxin
MIVSGSLELKDYMYEMRRCMRCASCKWLDHIYMPDNRFVYRCPSYGKYYFSKVAYGRLKLGLALCENRLDDTPGMKDMVFQCLMCGACDSGCKRNLDLEIMNSLEALRGKVVLIQYWATWCEPAKNDMALLKRLVEKYPKSFTVLGVSLDMDRKAMSDFLASARLPCL